MTTIKQVFEHYAKWEDFQNGLWRVVSPDEETVFTALAIDLLADESALDSAMRAVVSEWKISAIVNLTNYGQNRRAWLGQSACCFHSRCPEQCTRAAWNLLPRETQARANAIAERVILDWERAYRRAVLCLSEQLELTF